jgi:regulator of sirC expression with transglutaminase-like and TPR domain
MDSFKVLTNLYSKWLQRNKLNPLISADDLWHDHVNGQLTMHFRGVEKKYSLNDNQASWLRKFMEIWYKAEDYANRYNDRIADEQEKIVDLWNEYLYLDKRSFNEYFSEEFGFTCDEGITYKQMKVLCEKLIGRKQ